MKKLLTTLLILILFPLLLTSCASEEEEGVSQNATDVCTPVNQVLKPSDSDYKPLTIPDGGQKKGVITWVIDKVTSILVTASQDIYEELSQDEEYKAIIGICITLAIMFYAGSIMLGMRQLAPYEGFMFALKIVLIYNFAVNWDTFQFYVLDTLEAFIRDGINMASNTFSGYNCISEADCQTGVVNITVVGEIDKMLSFLWDFGMMKLVMALMLTGITGFFWGLGLFGFTILYLLAVLQTIKIFLLALIGRYVLYALGPIFLSFLLFNQTRALFDGWMRQLISFTLQPIFLFIFLGMFNAVIAGFVNTMFIDNLNNQAQYFKQEANGPPNPNGQAITVDSNYCIKKVKFSDTPLGDVYWWQLCSSTGPEADRCNQSLIKPTIPIDIWIILGCLIICYMMFTMTTWIVEVANTLASGAISLTGIHMQGMPQLKKAGGDLVRSGMSSLKTQATASRPPTGTGK